ncbi:MAG TPA: hypothetical protein VGN17_15405 [Bryobacteraceae bacterium]|jgi:uncharacterized protein (TIGR03437 family)
MRTISLLAVFSSVLAFADSPAPAVVSTASATIGITADSLATVYGNQLATQTAAAGQPPWPTALGDMPGVSVMDSAGRIQQASLIYVSPTQMNLWLPPGVAPGPATVRFPFTGLGVGVGTAALRIVPVNIQSVAPGLFSIDGSGTGVAAATAVRVVISTQMQGSVPVFACDTEGTGCKATPIDVGVDAPVFLTLYGTGIRGASSLANVSVTIGSTKVQPTFAGAQPSIPGLDQINVPLPLNLRGSGLVNVTVTVDGVVSNAVQIAIQ